MQTPADGSLSDLSNVELVRTTCALATYGRRVLVRMLEFLNEVEARKVFRDEGCSSMFKFCRRKLAFSEGESARRLAGARLMKKHPIVREALVAGTVHLTALHKIQKLVTSENVENLLERIRGKTKREIEDLLVELDPARALAFAPNPTRVSDQIRKLPTPHPVPSSSEQRASTAPLFDLARRTSVTVSSTEPKSPPTTSIAMSSPETTAPATAPARATSMVRTAQSSVATPPPPPSPVMPPAPAPVLAPASPPPPPPDRYMLKLTASRELRDNLERLKVLLAHSNPSGDIGPIVERAVALLLEKVEKERFGSRDTSRAVKPSIDPTYIPKRTKRIVHDRDDGRCTFVGSSGERCDERRHLHFDHIVPRALGGNSDPSNLRLLCAAHNAAEAERILGAEFIQAKIREHQERRAASRKATPDGTTAAIRETNPARPPPT